MDVFIKSHNQGGNLPHTRQQMSAKCVFNGFLGVQCSLTIGAESMIDIIIIIILNKASVFSEATLRLVGS